MRLYLFEHCSLCFRVRMAAALKRVHLQETVVLEDDSKTMIDLVGQRVMLFHISIDTEILTAGQDIFQSPLKYPAGCHESCAT